MDYLNRFVSQREMDHVYEKICSFIKEDKIEKLNDILGKIRVDKTPEIILYILKNSCEVKTGPFQCALESLVGSLDNITEEQNKRLTYLPDFLEKAKEKIVDI